MGIFLSEKREDPSHYPEIIEIITPFILTCSNLRYLIVWHMGHGEEGVEPGGGCCLGYLAPHQTMLLLHKELVVGGPGNKIV